MKFRKLVLIGVALSAFLLTTFIGCDENTPVPSDGPPIASQPEASIKDAPEGEETPMPASLRAALIKSRQEEGGPQYHAAFHDKLPTFTNGPHRLKAEMESDSLRIHPLDKQSDWSLEMRLSSLSRGDQTEPSVRATRSVNKNRAEYRRGNVTEWYLNGPVGLEQGFDIQQKPLDSAEGELRLNVEVNSDLSLEKRGDELVLLDENGGAALRAFGLIVLDARGKKLESRLDVSDNGFTIYIDDGGAQYPVVVDPVWGGEVKLLSDDEAPGDQLGFSVALDGNTALIGANLDDDNGNGSGSAYVFVRSGTTWTQQAKLLSSDGDPYDNFGYRVSLDGDTALIAAVGDDDNGNDSGSAYVFVRSGTTWMQQAKLVASDGALDDWFGYSVSLDGDTALIGAHRDDDNGGGSGSAYVFVRSGTTWMQQVKLLPSDSAPDELFGYSVSLDGDTALVSAPWDNDSGNWSGSAYVFARSGMTWTQQAKLLASDGEANDRFGYSVSMDGDTALIGTIFGNYSGTVSGSAYVFVRSGSTWTQQAKLLASDGAANDWFGCSVSMDGDKALIGAYGDDDNGDDSGSAYIFSRTGASWTQEAKLAASVGAVWDRFGYSLSLDVDTALVGSFGSKNNGVSSGSAYVFTFREGDGQPCTLGTDCNSGFCVDGVCCNTACGAGNAADCQACSIAAGAATDGLCEALDGNPCDDGFFCTDGETCNSGVCNSGTAHNCSAFDDQCNVGVCNDTTDTCEATPANEGNSCDDGLFCTDGETCNLGVCNSGSAHDCSAFDDQCNVGVCNETTNTCEATPANEGNPCDDGQFCTDGETCNSGVCNSGSALDCSALDDQCNIGVCNDTTNTCEAAPANEGNSCDDGLFCTDGETCNSGVCNSGSAHDCSALDDQCNVGICNDTTDSCETAPANEGNSCDDGLFCTDGETCNSGVCNSGTAHDCSAFDNQCNVGVCNDTTNTCEAAPANEGNTCDDGLFCTDGETCNSGVCNSGSSHDCSALDDQCNLGVCNDTTNACEAAPANEGNTCDDGLFCTDGETCNSGVCNSGSAHDCSAFDDQCNVGVCNDTTNTCEASPANEGNSCDDGLFCTDGETCNAGVCNSGTTHDCSSLDDQCNVGVCNDTTDSCEPTPANEGNSCDDGLFCTDGETCNSGVCNSGSAHDCSAFDDQCNVGVCNDTTNTCEASPANEGNSCDDGLFCTDSETCNSGVCNSGTAHDCSGLDDQCNVGICNDTADICEAAPANEGNSCDDGLFCTDGETCNAGDCDNGLAHDCSALDDQCNVGVCNDTTDACEASPANEGNICDDGLFCTDGETCNSGDCDSGTSHDCSALDDQCNTGVCNDTTDSCEASPANEGNSCDDGFFCTDGETCNSGVCNSGSTHDCSALDDQCNLGVCNDTTNSCEASPANEGNICDDGLFCTDGETCNSGVCNSGSTHDCSALDDQCNVGVCNDTTDSCEPSPSNEGNSCDDGLFCTDGETCNSGVCNSGSTHDCSGLDDQCNIGVCNDTTNTCEAYPANEGNSCDDGLFCTDGETCSSGSCNGGASHDCSALDDQCNIGVCNDATNTCEAAPANEGNTCDDGLFCTDGETCNSGVCNTGTAHDCSALDDQCNVGVCNDTTDACEPSPANEGNACDDGLFCNDGETCTGGVCDGGVAHDCSGLDDQCAEGVCNDTSDSCEASAINEGNTCDDGDITTIDDVCTAGECLGEPEPDAGPDAGEDAGPDASTDVDTDVDTDIDVDTDTDTDTGTSGPLGTKPPSKGDGCNCDSVGSAGGFGLFEIFSLILS